MFLCPSVRIKWGDCHEGRDKVRIHKGFRIREQDPQGRICPYKIENGKINWLYEDVVVEVFMPMVVIEGDQTRLVEAVESERLEKTYEEYEAAHGDEERIGFPSGFFFRLLPPI